MAKSKLDKAAELLTGDTPDVAGARCIIKRTLRKMQLPVTEDVRELAGFFVAHPWSCTEAIEATLKRSVQAYERDDTPGEQRYASHVERLMSLLGVQLDWPGLYPTFQYKLPKPANLAPGLWGGGECYSLSQLWRLIKDVRAAEGSAE